MPSYKISFPDIEVNSIHGKQAILDAIDELKQKAQSSNDWTIKWTETHTDECDCNNCVEERN